MEIKEISPVRFLSFAQTYPYTIFYQSIDFTEMKVKAGMQAYYVGGFQDDTLVGASIILWEPMAHFWKYCIAVKGFLIDYQNKKLVNDFTKGVKAFLKKHGALLLRINPAFRLQEHDAYGRIVEHGYDHHDWVETLKQCGFRHEGYTVGFHESEHVRWIMTIDLKGKDEAALLKNMTQLTRRNLRTAQKSHVKITEICDVKDLHVFMELMQKTSKRRHFTIFNPTYYEDQFTFFSRHKHIKFLVAQFYVKAYIDDLNREKTQLKDKLNEIAVRLSQDKTNEKSVHKRDCLFQQLNSVEKHLSKAEAIYQEKGDCIPIAVANFILYQNEITYFHGGSDEVYMQYCGQFALQWYMMRYGLEHGYERFNLNGISGMFSDDAIDHGVYLFKRGLGGIVEEYPDYFTMPIKKLTYDMVRVMMKIKGIIRK